jgi:hypothetical protein
MKKSTQQSLLLRVFLNVVPVDGQLAKKYDLKPMITCQLVWVFLETSGIRGTKLRSRYPTRLKNFEESESA